MALANATNPALSAFNNGNLGVSFGGAGYLILYYAGILKIFEQIGIYQPTKRGGLRVAGVSSGALTTAAVCSGTTADAFHSRISSMTGKCYDEPSACTGSMDENLRRTLSDFLPKDAAERCNGTGFVSVTVYDSGAPTAGVVSSFSDRSDLIGTLAASSYIPFWSGSQLVTDWRGRQALDGSVSTRQPACPDASKYCIRIASRAPDMNGGATAGENSGNRFGNAFRQIRLAMSGARSSAGSVPKPKLPSLAEAKADPARLEMYKAKGLDIAPGLAAPNPFPPETWSELSTLPCDPETCNYIYAMGQIDAMAWAKAMGIADAAEAAKKAAVRRLSPAEPGKQGKHAPGKGNAKKGHRRLMGLAA